jgi:hypothetical protein
MVSLTAISIAPSASASRRRTRQCAGAVASGTSFDLPPKPSR